MECFALYTRSPFTHQLPYADHVILWHCSVNVNFPSDETHSQTQMPTASMSQLDKLKFIRCLIFGTIRVDRSLSLVLGVTVCVSVW